MTKKIVLPVIAAIGMLPFGLAAAHADDNSFLRYLADHGYTAAYAGGEPITPASARALGHMICENLHVGRSVGQQEPNYPQWPQFPLMAEAAQHELCPDTLG
jgi:hypothetical protein